MNILDYPALPDEAYVIWWSNGKLWPDAGRELAYLCPGPKYAQYTRNCTQALTFGSFEEASSWLAHQSYLRRVSFTDLNITTVKELRERVNYPSDPAHYQMAVRIKAYREEHQCSLFEARDAVATQMEKERREALKFKLHKAVANGATEFVLLHLIDEVLGQQPASS